MKSYVVNFEQDLDSDDLLLPFPPEFVFKLGWNEDTDLEWHLSEDNHLILREKE